MKPKIVFVLIALAAIFFIDGCEKEKEDQSDLNFSGELKSYSDCKSFKTTNAAFDIPDTLCCVNYTFDASANKLIINHINSGFNCCPEILYCTITLKSDTIVIQEKEKEAGCNCLCLFDLDMEITGVETKKYQVKLIEPYAEDEEKLEFEMDLPNDKSGSACVVRKNYPWGAYH
jgi:hypothetical protein